MTLNDKDPDRVFVIRSTNNLPAQIWRLADCLLAFLAQPNQEGEVTQY